jgi:hypothetical protein
MLLGSLSILTGLARLPDVLRPSALGPLRACPLQHLPLVQPHFPSKFNCPISYILAHYFFLSTRWHQRMRHAYSLGVKFLRGIWTLSPASWRTKPDFLMQGEFGALVYSHLSCKSGCSRASAFHSCALSSFTLPFQHLGLEAFLLRGSIHPFSPPPHTRAHTHKLTGFQKALNPHNPFSWETATLLHF